MSTDSCNLFDRASIITNRVNEEENVYECIPASHIYEEPIYINNDYMFSSTLSYQPLSDEETKRIKKEKEIQELKDEFNNFTCFLENRVH